MCCHPCLLLSYVSEFALGNLSAFPTSLSILLLPRHVSQVTAVLANLATAGQALWHPQVASLGDVVTKMEGLLTDVVLHIASIGNSGST